MCFGNDFALWLLLFICYHHNLCLIIIENKTSKRNTLKCIPTKIRKWTNKSTRGWTVYKYYFEILLLWFGISHIVEKNFLMDFLFLLSLYSTLE